jgi:hypothetical protein
MALLWEEKIVLMLMLNKGLSHFFCEIGIVFFPMSFTVVASGQAFKTVPTDQSQFDLIHLAGIMTCLILM